MAPIPPHNAAAPSSTTLYMWPLMLVSTCHVRAQRTSKPMAITSITVMVYGRLVRFCPAPQYPVATL